MIKLTGNKKDGYILEIKDKKYNQQVQIKHDELLELQIIINKKSK